MKILRLEIVVGRAESFIEKDFTNLRLSVIFYTALFKQHWARSLTPTDSADQLLIPLLTQKHSIGFMFWRL